MASSQFSRQLFQFTRASIPSLLPTLPCVQVYKLSQRLPALLLSHVQLYFGNLRLAENQSLKGQA